MSVTLRLHAAMLRRSLSVQVLYMAQKSGSVLEWQGRKTTKLTVVYSRQAISYADVSFIALARQASGDEALSYGGAISVTKRCSYC